MTPVEVENNGARVFYMVVAASGRGGVSLLIEAPMVFGNAAGKGP